MGLDSYLHLYQVVGSVLQQGCYYNFKGMGLHCKLLSFVPNLQRAAVHLNSVVTQVDYYLIQGREKGKSWNLDAKNAVRLYSLG